MKDHDCAKPGCDVVVPGYMLACLTHWTELPGELRGRINRAWQQRRTRGTDEAVGAHLATVLEAMDVWLAGQPAIEAVREMP